jgi:hypothetical protein
MLRPLTDPELTAARALIDEVSARARISVPGIESLVAFSDDHAVVVAGRLADAVARVLRNPDGKVQESIDDYAYRRSDAVADGTLYLSPEDVLVLSGAPAPGSAAIPGPHVVSLSG